MTQRSWASGLTSDAPDALRRAVPQQRRAPLAPEQGRLPAGAHRAAAPVTVPVAPVPVRSWAPDAWAPWAAGRQPAAVEALGARGLGRWLVNATVLVVVVVFLGLAVGPRSGAYQTTTMLTGSMRPSYPPGSVLVLTPMPVDDLEAGHVITFHAPVEDKRVVTHRVVSVDRSGERPVMVTKGDANSGADPWKAVVTQDVVWRARFAVPGVGRAIQELREPWAQLALTRGLPALLLVSLLVTVWRPERPGA